MILDLDDKQTRILYDLLQDHMECLGVEFLAKSRNDRKVVAKQIGQLEDILEMLPWQNLKDQDGSALE